MVWFGDDLVEEGLMCDLIDELVMGHIDHSQGKALQTLGTEPSYLYCSNATFKITPGTQV
jgi:hypothetical protein